MSVATSVAVLMPVVHSEAMKKSFSTLNRPWSLKMTYRGVGRRRVVTRHIEKGG